MFYGSLVFIGTEDALDKAAQLIDAEVIVTPDVLEYDGPIEVTQEPAGHLYNVEFGIDQWIDIFSLRNTLAENNIDLEVIHALTDNNTYIEVLSTTGEYDIVVGSDDPSITDLAIQYNLDIANDTILLEDGDDEDEDDIIYDECDDWN